MAILYLRYLSSGENLGGCGMRTAPPQLGHRLVFSVYLSHFWHFLKSQTIIFPFWGHLVRHLGRFLRWRQRPSAVPLQVCVQQPFVCFFPYSRVESFSPLIFALPPVGSARVSPQTLQVTLFVAFPKSCCSFPHFRHLTRKKLLRGLGISLFQSLMFCFASLLYG